MKASAIVMKLLESMLMVSSSKELPDADCDNCKLKCGSYAEYPTNQWCYMFEERPGDRCGQFKVIEKAHGIC